LHEAWEQWVAAWQRDSGGGSVTGYVFHRAPAEGEGPDESVERWRLWRAKPDRTRTEFQAGTETVKAILIDPEWWSWSPSRGFMMNGGDPSSSHGVGPGEILVDTPKLLSSLRLRAVSRTTFLSRSAYAVFAEPVSIERNAPSHVLHALGAGADRYQLRVDAEIGILLRCQAERGGQPFRVVEVEELGINEKLDDSLFSSNRLAP
jgi:hypothetical protein